MFELEPLISSKIRRALLEHFLTHPGERFYLRGLAKTLNLSVSPARRELLRLEHLGVLKAYPEANIRFYVIDPASPLVTQLKAYQQAPSALELHQTTVAVQTQPPAPAPVELPVAVAATVLSQAKVERIRRALKPSIPWLAVLGAAAVTVAMLVVGVGSYLEITNSRWNQLARDLVRAPRTQVTVVEQPALATRASVSGEMHSSRWRIVPGGAGTTFSAGSGANSY